MYRISKIKRFSLHENTMQARALYNLEHDLTPFLFSPFFLTFQTHKDNQFDPHTIFCLMLPFEIDK